MGGMEDFLPATEDVNHIFESFHAKRTDIIDNHVPFENNYAHSC